MPTPRAAFAAVAAAISGIHADDAAAVEAFYSRDIFALPAEAQLAIGEFLVAQTEVPTREALRRLVLDVGGDVPEPVAVASRMTG